MLSNSAHALPLVEADELLASLEAGFALPSHWYTDRALFAREREFVLRRSWHYGAHLGQLAKPGDQALCRIAGVPVVLTRDDAGEVRGFVNICRHRAHQVVLEPGNRKTMQCLYHGWTYNLDGCLRRAPRAESELEFDPSQFGLVPVQTAVWGPMVWVNLDVEAPPFSDWVGGLPELAASHGLDLSQHVYAFEREWEIGANWKVFLDNAIECYHCPTCHPSLSQVLEMDPDLHILTVGARHWIWHDVPYQKSAEDVAAYYGIQAGPTAEPPRYQFHWIYPTTYFQYRVFNSTVSGFDLGTLDVVGVDRFVFRHRVFLPVGTPQAEVDERKHQLATGETIPEDIAICERVQAAHEANAVPPGRLLPRSEWLLQHFQRVLIETMANGA